MKRPVDHGAMALAGYATPWSVKAGEQVGLHVSCARPVRHIGLRRLDLPVAAPVHWQIASTGEPPEHRAFEQGSYLRLSAEELAKAGRIDGFSFELLLTLNAGSRTIFEAGAFRLRLADELAFFEHGATVLIAGAKLPARSWISVRIGAEEGSVSLRIDGHDQLAPYGLHRRFEGLAWAGLTGDLLLGADSDGDEPALNAKFAAVGLETENGRFNWTFPTRLPTGSLHSSGSLPLKLQALNQPSFCMISRRWDGTSFDPRLVPSHYDAIHCHDDDMAPLDWPASYVAQVPADAASGCYAFTVEYDGGSEDVAFFVSAHEPRAPLVFLVPTATYLAYADEFLPPHLYDWKCEDRGQRFAADNNLRSLYDYHSDLSGVSICSYKKPKATLREDYRYPLCGCPHNFPVDLHFLRFCRANGIGIDIITDHDLHERGAELLRGYRAIVTGSHPEYMSVEMELAIRTFLADGGSLAYLGGNGFAGAVAFSGDLMELRRSPLEAVRTWDGPVAEQALSITNEPGGPLRARGRGEFSLIGGAISLMGFEDARPFTRTPESHAPEHAWLFEGVEEQSFGHEGIVLGGAAGYEVDATDPHLGTSPDVTVIARATGFPRDFVHDPSRWYAGGEAEAAGRRCAEMTVRPLAAGGLIFSASSVAWCGALPGSGTMNDVGRITLNLLRRLSDPSQGGRDAGQQPKQQRGERAC